MSQLQRFAIILDNCKAILIFEQQIAMALIRLRRVIYDFVFAYNINILQQNNCGVIVSLYM